MPMSPRLLRPRASGLVLPSDADARAYVQAVNTADGQPLEAPVVQAIDAFVIGCKADGIWSAIQASCILMGARTLAGALTPLVGPAPTNNGPFVAADYVRGGATPGLIGNGSTKFLDTNRAANADGQDDAHAAVWATVLPTNVATDYKFYFGAQTSGGQNTTSIENRPVAGDTDNVGCRSLSASIATGTRQTGFKGVSRSSSASFVLRNNGATTTFNVTSAASVTQNYRIFASANRTGNRSDARIAFYSLGSSLTLTSLESRVSTLVAALANVT